MSVRAVNHVAIVVESIEQALSFWRDALGLPLERIAAVEAEAVKVAFLPVGESEIELLEPTDAASGVARYLEKRGPGIHHVCVEVEDIDATMAQLRAHGVVLINESPREGEGGKRYAFVHPKSAGGVPGGTLSASNGVRGHAGEAKRRPGGGSPPRVADFWSGRRDSNP